MSFAALSTIYLGAELRSAVSEVQTEARAARRFAAVSDLLADTSMAYGSGSRAVAAGDTVEEGGHRYRVQASASAHISTAGGIGLNVLPGPAGEYSADALGPLTAAKLQALSSSMANGDVIRLGSPATLAGGVTFAEGVSFLMDGTVTYSGTGPAFTFGSASTFQQYPARYVIRLVRATPSDFSSLSDIGAKWINIANSKIHLELVEGFTINAQGLGSGTDRGFAWNEVHIARCNNFLIGFDLGFVSSGFANENRFIAGHFVQRNTVATSATTLPAFVSSGQIRCYGFRLGAVNGNAFDKPAIELNNTRSSDGQVFKGSGFLLEGAIRNRATGMRFEASDVVARITGTAVDNNFEVLYSDPSNPPTLDDQSARRNNSLRIADDWIITQAAGAWDSGNLHESAHSYNASSWSLPNAGFAINSVHADPILNSNNVGWKALRGYVQAVSNLQICVRLDTSKQKRFVLKREVVAGFGGRVAFSARKADGTIWTSSDPNAPYVFCDRTLSYNSVVFANWGLSSDWDGDLFFEVRSDVDHVVIGQSGGTSPLRLKRFQIIALEGGVPVVSSGIRGRTGAQRVSQISPTLGYYARGEMVQNHNNAAAQAIGWKADADGWAAQTAWVASTAYAVDDIIYNGTAAYQCVTAGTSAASGGPTGTGLAIADGTTAWDYIAPRTQFRAGPVMP